MEIYGTAGSIFIDLMTKQGGSIFIKHRLSEQTRPNGWNNLGVLWRYGYQGEAKQFVSCVLGRSPARATGFDAIEAQKLAILADRSIRTGELVRVS